MLKLKFNFIKDLLKKNIDKKKIILIQKYWRGYISRKKLKKMKIQFKKRNFIFVSSPKNRMTKCSFKINEFSAKNFEISPISMFKRKRKINSNKKNKSNFL